MDRRAFLQAVTMGGLCSAVGGFATACQFDLPPIELNLDLGYYLDPASYFGALGTADANGLRLPTGFTSRVVATTGQTVAGTSHVWHPNPDGGACFPTPSGGWIYVSNNESNSPGGGVGAVEFSSTGAIVAARSILSGTARNCAGGTTPWGTWLSCEEISTGRVWECDPSGVSAPVVRPAMGRFNHEAAACDDIRQVVYLTEDASDSGLYRFRPTTWGDLSGGTLDVLCESAGVLSWKPIPDPDGSPTATRDQVASMKIFNGGEGIALAGSGTVVFSTKGDNRVWAYEPDANTLTQLYDDNTSSTPVLTGVDNLTFGPQGLLYVAEDGGNMEIVAVGADQKATPVVQITGVSSSEVTGPAFSPDGQRLYFSSQRNPGRTYEVTGPWR